MANQKKKQSFAEDARPRFGAVVGLLLLAGVMLAGTSCSSSSTSSANSLTSDQRAALNEAAEAFDNAESSGLVHVWLTVVLGFMLRVRVDHRMRVRTRLG